VVILKKKQRIRRRIHRLRLAQQILQDRINNFHVGSGNVAHGGIRRQSAILPRQAMKDKMVHQVLHAPHKLQEAIGCTGKEFMYMAFYYELVRRLRGGLRTPDSRFRMTSWKDVWPELFLLWDYLGNEKTFRQIEAEYQYVFSSVAVTL
jgi:hypothetical protein